VYLDRQGAGAFHPLPSPNRSLDKTSMRMACLSTHLALPQVVCCHTETGLELSIAEHQSGKKSYDSWQGILNFFYFS